MDVCTIIARNYVAFARTLARSVAEQRPGARCFVLVIDGAGETLEPSAEPFELVEPAALGIERFDLMAGMYDVLELSTAVKPWLLRHLMHERGVEQLLYLDPDIRLYDPLDGVTALLDEHPVVVTPHLTEPMPRDGAKPDEQDILTSGSFNLGFLGLARGAEADRLIDWWAERLETDCIIAPERGFFVDQRWIDFAPGLVEGLGVLRDPGYNVAYWNLAGRALRRAGDGHGYEVNGRPLRFFHFSGYDPRLPDRISKHQDRIDFVDEPALRELYDAYGAELLANGFEDAADWPYGHAELGTGLAWDRPLRSVLRDGVVAGELDADPFTETGADALVEWANGPAVIGGEHGVTRYLAAFHARRRDLRRDLPDLDGADGPRLLAWAEIYGRGQIDPAFMPGAGHVRPVLPGVNLAGYFDAVLGVGEAGRQVADALNTQGVPIAAVGLVASGSPQGEREPGVDAPRRDAPHAINLLCINADQVPPLAAHLGEGFFTGRYTIGMWWWEVERFPERWLEAFEHVDEVWAGTRHVADALELVSPVPVVKVTLPISPPSFEPLSRERLGFPGDDFVFLLVFDYLSIPERKNPLALAEAFRQAFSPGEGAALVVKSMNSARYPDYHRRLVQAAAGHPDIHLIDRHVPRAEKDAMIGACDAYASLHRAEGFGITLAEAMRLGKPVIATGYSGNLDFMSPENSWLVDHALVPVGEGHEPYPADARWAEPDVEHAARCLRAVFDDRDAARLRAARGAAEIAATHSPAAAGKTLARRLVRVSSFAGARGLRGPLRIADTSRAAKLVRSGPVGVAAPSRASALKGSARRAMLRLLKPYTVHQQRVDHELLQAVHTLDRSVQSIAATQADVEAALSDLRAAPYRPRTELALSAHPAAGVVEGFSEGSASALNGPPAPGEDPLAALLAGHEPVLELGLGDEGRRALELTEPGSAGAVLVGPLIGALGDSELAALLKAGAAALRPGGVLVVEAPNPHSVQGAKLLASDPAHQRAVYPELLLDLCRDAGLPAAFWFCPGGVGNVEADRHREPRFAVVASATAPRTAQRPAADPTR